MYYGWYSKTQSKLLGTIFWQKEDGSEVEVTNVSHSPEHTSKFGDVEFRGPVTKWLRKGKDKETSSIVQIDLSGKKYDLIIDSSRQG